MYEVTFFNRSKEGILDSIHQIKSFREFGTTWGEDRETFIENRLERIEYLLNEMEDSFNNVCNSIEE